ncbi:hypothetical protein vBSscSF1_101 [Staphylococcus phage vB-SscS-F1]|nr:hypothetical protein vBApySJF1_101 [Arcanobacterium phage vB-ApyS-JF1]
MRLKAVEENGNVTIITGSFFGELNLTVTNKEGEVIHEFSGTALEMREMQKMTQDESREHSDSSEESGHNIKETEEEREMFLDDRPDPEPEDLEFGDKVELIDDFQTLVYEQGDILTVIKPSETFNNNYEVIGNNGRSQIISRNALKSLGERSKFFVLNKRGEQVSSSFKKGTIVKVLDDEGDSFNTPTTDSTGLKQYFGPEEFETVVVDDNGLDDDIEEVFEFSKENDIRLTVDNLDELIEQKEKGVKKIKLQPNTLYYLKERIYDNSGDSVGPGLVTFDDRFGALGFIDQYDKEPVAIDGHYLEKDKIFKVKRDDIVKVVGNEKSGNGVVGKTGFLLRSGRSTSNKLVKGKRLGGPYVNLAEVEPVSDKKAQKFFEKEITKTKTRG